MLLEEARAYVGKTLVRRFLDRPTVAVTLVKVGEYALYVRFPGADRVVTMSPDFFSPPRAKAFSWDWQEQPDMARIAAFVTEVSGGRVHLREADDGSDNYTWVVSDYPVDDAEAERVLDASTVTPEELERGDLR
jgi:hypothetical protein